MGGNNAAPRRRGLWCASPSPNGDAVRQVRRSLLLSVLMIYSLSVIMHGPGTNCPLKTDSEVRWAAPLRIILPQGRSPASGAP